MPTNHFPHIVCVGIIHSIGTYMCGVESGTLCVRKHPIYYNERDTLMTTFQTR